MDPGLGGVLHDKEEAEGQHDNDRDRSWRHFPLLSAGCRPRRAARDRSSPSTSGRPFRSHGGCPARKFYPSPTGGPARHMGRQATPRPPSSSRVGSSSGPQPPRHDQTRSAEGRAEPAARCLTTCAPGGFLRSISDPAQHSGTTEAAHRRRYRRGRHAEVSRRRLPERAFGAARRVRVLSRAGPRRSASLGRAVGRCQRSWRARSGTSPLPTSMPVDVWIDRMRVVQPIALVPGCDLGAASAPPPLSEWRTGRAGPWSSRLGGLATRGGPPPLSSRRSVVGEVAPVAADQVDDVGVARRVDDDVAAPRPLAALVLEHGVQEECSSHITARSGGRGGGGPRRERT